MVAPTEWNGLPGEVRKGKLPRFAFITLQNGVKLNCSVGCFFKRNRVVQKEREMFGEMGQFKRALFIKGRGM